MAKRWRHLTPGRAVSASACAKLPMRFVRSARFWQCATCHDAQAVGALDGIAAKLHQLSARIG